MSLSNMRVLALTAALCAIQRVQAQPANSEYENGYDYDSVEHYQYEDIDAYGFQEDAIDTEIYDEEAVGEYYAYMDEVQVIN